MRSSYTYVCNAAVINATFDVMYACTVVLYAITKCSDYKLDYCRVKGKSVNAKVEERGTEQQLSSSSVKIW